MTHRSSRVAERSTWMSRFRWHTTSWARRTCNNSSTEEAIAELQKAIQLSDGNPTSTANLARAYAASGRRHEAVQLLNELKRRSSPSYSNAPEIAMIYAALGDSDQAMTWLEQGYEERFNPGVLLRPGFDPLRSDPRFQTLARRVGLNK